MCRDFLHSQFVPDWSKTTETLGLAFIGPRGFESLVHLTRTPNLEMATGAIEKACLGSADTMIVNFLFAPFFDPCH